MNLTVEPLIFLLAMPGIVIVVQSGPWPESWFKYAPLGCPLCLSALFGGVAAGCLPECSIWLALGGIVTTLVTAGHIPWAFRWGAVKNIVTVDPGPTP